MPRGAHVVQDIVMTPTKAGCKGTRIKWCAEHGNYISPKCPGCEKAKSVSG